MYLKTNYFSRGGMRPDNYVSWKSIMNRYSERSYIPIVNFPVTKLKDETQIREKLLSQINSILFKIVGGDIDCKSALSYLISEMTDNIVDHSNESRGWITAQYFKSKGFIDICILDTGKGLLESYKQNNYNDVKNDKLAITKALDGVSTKKDKERGFGIRTSRNMILKGLKGEFVLITGKGILYNDNLIDLPGGKWRGTMLALRIKKPALNFKYLDYVN